MTNPVIVIAMYRPKEGKSTELEALVKKHFPTLKEHGLTTDREPFIGRAADGTLVEVFEWITEEAAERAHDHPVVAKIWDAMANACDFGKLEQLDEAKVAFPHFQKAFGA